MGLIGRMFLFFLVNALVVMTMTVILNLLGVKPYLNQYGLDIPSLAMFCAVWGMGGSFISLLLSRTLSKWQYRVQVIPEDTRDPSLSQLVQMVRELSRKANLPKMPEVGIYDSPEPNAWATGPSKSMATVAVSTGLLSRMNMAEIEGVLGHEISHIANGDMVTMTLLQGIMNAFVMFLSRLVAFVLTSNRDRDDRGPGFMYYIVQFVLQTVFMILGSIVVAWFSRWREYRADAGSARIAGKEKMIAALQELQQSYELAAMNTQPAMQTMQISAKSGGIWKLWDSHPPLEERIRRLAESN
ncbi:MAG: protease HtpX [Candidatus Obscuribacterales bacterium]|nr:protease HtpX [Candidatus Obscuribacterales bacterium]